MKSLYNRTSGLQIYQVKTPTQVFFCEYCEISKNTYLQENLQTAASEWLTGQPLPDNLTVTNL